MSTPGDFVSRWSRLKREANSARHARSEVKDPHNGPVEPPTGRRPGLPGNDAAAIEPFDEASLPSIDAITRYTDIRAFLLSQVPEDLTRAALRKAWTSDPAIRDFIGIAENQWDFNDPNAMAGFGLLRPDDNASALLEQGLSNGERVAETIVEVAGLNHGMPVKEGGSPKVDGCSTEAPNDDHRDKAARAQERVDNGDAFTTRRHSSAIPR